MPPSPYRQAPRPVATPTELTYVPHARADQRAGCLPALVLVGIPTAAGSILCVLAGPMAGMAAFLLAFGVAAWRWVQRPTPGLVIRVQSGELHVFPRRSTGSLLRIALADLDDVVLETKTVERVELGDPNMGVAFTLARIAPPTDTNRIVLQPRGGAPVPMTEEFGGHADTLEWFGKIRVFLRKSGWTPASERASESADAEDDAR